MSQFGVESHSQLTPGGNRVKLKTIAQRFSFCGKVLNFLIVLSGVNASFTAMVTLKVLCHSFSLI